MSTQGEVALIRVKAYLALLAEPEKSSFGKDNNTEKKRLIKLINDELKIIEKELTEKEKE